MDSKTILKMKRKGLISEEMLIESGILDEDEFLTEEETAAEEAGKSEAPAYVSTVTMKDTLLEMMLIMVLWGILVELGGVFWISGQLSYTLGVLIGTALALGSAFHLSWCINRSLEYGSHAKAKSVSWALLRYFVIVGVFALMIFAKIANPIAAFIALMGLKVSAYLQPLTHRMIEKRR